MKFSYHEILFSKLSEKLSNEYVSKAGARIHDIRIVKRNIEYEEG